MVSVEEALQLIASVLPAPRAEDVPVAEGHSRILARDLVADVDWPPFDTSAMDGYAVRLADVLRPGDPVTERASAITAGDAPPPPLNNGEVARVMTGAPLPAGTEAVIPIEDARRVDGSAIFNVVPAAGAHIRRKGESLTVGSVLRTAGQRMTASDIALAALAGADPLSVFSRTPITVAATGNELVEPSSRPGPGKLRDSNGPMLLALCRARGWPAKLAPRVTDDAKSIEKLFHQIRGPQILITSGGVSAGELDLLPGVARRCGFEILFHGVAIQPGKPIAFARREDSFWFGLPGNPVSSAVGFHVFVRAALDRLEGSAAPGTFRVSARLTRGVRAAGARESYRDAHWRIENGESLAEPLATRGSHDLAAHARSNALIRLPAGSGPAAEGTVVECLILSEMENLRSASTSNSNP